MHESDIEKWLKDLKSAWEGCDVDAALRLFADKVEYWESPWHLVAPEELNDLWQSIRIDRQTKVSTKVVFSSGSNHAIVWKATWRDESGLEHNKQGTYLVRLNSSGLCEYFYRTSMEQKGGLV
jgi:hypothetical protein